MTIALSLNAVAVKRGDKFVVRHVDLAVRRGSWFGLIGANGSGKTSLLRAIGGRLPIAAGSCSIDGQDITDNRVARAKLIGFAPPSDRLPDAMRTLDIFELVGGDMALVWARLGPLREALGLDLLLNRWIGDCSAGMRQRVAIALAFAGGHSLVILDEPFNWLDPVAAFDLKQVLRSMVANGLTLLTALHDLSTLITCCDAGAILVDGDVGLTLDPAMLSHAAGDPQTFERSMIDLLRSGGRSTA